MIVAVTATVILTATPRPFNVKGTLSIVGSVVDDPDGTCSGGLGFVDVTEGTEVTIADASGATVAIGKLGRSKPDADGLSCVWGFTVANVPGGKSFYGVEVGHRGTVKFTEKQLRAGIGLSLSGL